MGCQKSQNYQRGGDLGGLDCWGLSRVGDMAWLGQGELLGGCWELGALGLLGIVGSWGHGRRIMVKLNSCH